MRKFARYSLYLIVLISGIVFLGTALNVYTIQKQQGTSLSESISIHLVAKGRGIFGQQTVRTSGALTYNITPAPQFLLALIQ